MATYSARSRRGMSSFQALTGGFLNGYDKIHLASRFASERAHERAGTLRLDPAAGLAVGHGLGTLASNPLEAARRELIVDSGMAKPGYVL